MEEENLLSYFEPRGTQRQYDAPTHSYMIPSVHPVSHSVKSIEVTGKGLTGKNDLRERAARIKKVE